MHYFRYIFRLRLNGLNVERVTNPSKGSRHSEISFSEDGTKMLYAEFQPNRKTSLIMKDIKSGDEITIMSSKRSGDEFYKPFVHPTGDEVVFLRNMAKDSTYIFDIFSLDVKSGKIENLTNTPNISERMPNWSDDGRYLVYSSNAQGFSFDLYKCLRGDDSSIQISFVNSRQELNGRYLKIDRFLQLCVRLKYIGSL